MNRRTGHNTTKSPRLTGGDDRPKVNCSLPGCDAEHQARGYCAAHYQRWRRYGDALGEAPVQRQMHGKHDDKLPAGPILAALERRPAGKIGTANQAALEGARQTGEIAAIIADRIAIQVLGVHPSFIYGDAWWLPVDDEMVA